MSLSPSSSIAQLGYLDRLVVVVEDVRMSDVKLRELERTATTGTDQDRASWLAARIRRGESSKIVCCETGTVTLAELAIRGIKVDFVSVETPKGQANGWLHWTDFKDSPDTQCPRCKGAMLLPLSKAVELAAVCGDRVSQLVTGKAPRKGAPFYSWVEEIKGGGREVMVRASLAMARCALAKRWPDLQGEVVMEPLAEWNAAWGAVEVAERWLNHPCADCEEKAEVAHVGTPTWASLPYAAINEAAHWPRMVSATAKLTTGRALKEAVTKALVPVLLS